MLSTVARKSRRSYRSPSAAVFEIPWRRDGRCEATVEAVAMQDRTGRRADNVNNRPMLRQRRSARRCGPLNGGVKTSCWKSSRGGEPYPRHTVSYWDVHGRDVLRSLLKAACPNLNFGPIASIARRPDQAPVISAVSDVTAEFDGGAQVVYCDQHFGHGLVTGVTRNWLGRPARHRRQLHARKVWRISSQVPVASVAAAPPRSSRSSFTSSLTSRSSLLISFTSSRTSFIRSRTSVTTSAP